MEPFRHVMPNEMLRPFQSIDALGGFYESLFVVKGMVVGLSILLSEHQRDRLAHVGVRIIGGRLPHLGTSVKPMPPSSSSSRRTTDSRFLFSKRLSRVPFRLRRRVSPSPLAEG